MGRDVNHEAGGGRAAGAADVADQAPPGPAAARQGGPGIPMLSPAAREDLSLGSCHGKVEAEPHTTAARPRPGLQQPRRSRSRVAPCDVKDVPEVGACQISLTSGPLAFLGRNNECGWKGPGCLAGDFIFRAPAPARRYDDDMAGGSEPPDDPVGLSSRDMPEVFHTADQSSLSAQARFLTSMRIQLAALAVAAAFGAYTWHWPGTGTDAAALIAACAFAVAGVLRAGSQKRRLERTWYDGRAAAESAKTMAWRYAVGGKPFALESDGSVTDADAELHRRLQELPESLRDLEIVPSSEGGRQITPGMRAMRRLPLDRRKEAYATGRIQDQQRWYANKARWNKQRADRWNAILVAVEAAGAVGAVVKATTDVPIDVLPVAAAVVAGATAYLQTKQHDTLASAYTVAYLELASVADLVDAITDEVGWAGFVDEAENAISREHTLWRARRSERKDEEKTADGAAPSQPRQP